MSFYFSINGLVKSEVLLCIPTCTWNSCSQLVKGVPLAGLLPVSVVAFITCSNTSEQFKVIILYGSYEKVSVWFDL